MDLTPDNGGTLTIRTDDMEVAGEIVQDMCGFLGVTELESVADFPSEMENFRAVLMQVHTVLYWTGLLSHRPFNLGRGGDRLGGSPCPLLFDPHYKCGTEKDT